MTPRPSSFPFLIAAAFLFPLAITTLAHPLPDIPVRASFDSSGSVSIDIEIDPRSFVEDPLHEPYLQNWVLEASTDAEKADLISKARKLIEDRVELHFLPAGEVKPELKFQFTGQEKGVLVNKDDPVMLTGTWTFPLPKEATGYQIKAKNVPPFSVLYHNRIDGLKVERFQVLFPGESSYVLNLTDLKTAAEALRTKTSAAAPAPARQGFGYAFRVGFTEILPMGEEQLLFVLALGLAANGPKVMSGELLAFIAANSLTLILAIKGVWLVSAPVANGLTAVSLPLLAAYSLWGEASGRSRLGVIALLGLPHGLALGDAFRTHLAGEGAGEWLGFHGGVEIALLVFAALTALVFAGIREITSYRKLVAVPVSILVGVLGLFWALQALF